MAAKIAVADCNLKPCLILQVKSLNYALLQFWSPLVPLVVPLLFGFELLPMMEVMAATRAEVNFGSEVIAAVAALTVSTNEAFSIPKIFEPDINF